MSHLVETLHSEEQSVHQKVARLVNEPDPLPSEQEIRLIECHQDYGIIPIIEYFTHISEIMYGSDDSHIFN